MTLTTARCILRPVLATDLPDLIRLNQHPIVMQYFPSPLSPEQSRILLDKMMTHQQTHGFSYFSVLLKENKQFIGLIGLLNTSFNAHFTPNVEIAWRLHHSFWGQGLATEGAVTVLDHAFNDLHLPEVVSFTVPSNIPSRRVMEKIGLQYKPKQSFEHPSLAPTDPLCYHVLYRLTRQQYMNRNHS